MSRYQPIGPMNRATRYLVRERRGKARLFRLTSVPLPFVGRRRRLHERPHVLAQLVWLAFPGLFLPLVALANPNKTMEIDLVDTLFFFTTIVLVVRAWVAPAHWSVRAVGVIASLAFPVMRVVLG